MKTIYVRKRFVLVILCTILLTLLAAPIYSNSLLRSFWQSRHINKTARIDIKNTPLNTNTVEILEIQAPAGTQTTFPQWCANKNGNCAVLNATISSSWNDFVIKFKAIGAGKIVIDLRGPDVRQDNVRYPVFVSYRKATINGKPILKKRKDFWHDKPLHHVLEAKDGETIELRFQARKYHFRFGTSKINFLLFLSVLILSFLLSYKIVQYVSKFKLMEYNSRIDIVFAVVFFVLLFVPMSHISTAEKSFQENRMLAKYPNVFENTLNLNYGTQFEKWYNDRFFGRNSALDLYAFLNRTLNRIYINGGAVWVKNNNWMFSAQKALNPMRDKEIDNTAKAINLLGEFCRQHKIKMYVLVVPSKESVYFEYLPPFYKNSRQDFEQYLQSIYKTLALFNVPSVFPYNELRLALQKDFVFFKQTHHWSDWGAYNGYLALMNVIQKDYPHIHISHLSEYNVSKSTLLREDWDRNFGTGQTAALLKIDKEYTKKNLLLDDYTYYDHKQIIKPQITDINGYKIKYFKNPQQPKAPKVFLTGTSMNEDFLQFLPYSFSETKYFRLNNVLNVPQTETFKLLKRYKQDILDFKPDILILCITAGNLQFLENLTKD